MSDTQKTEEPSKAKQNQIKLHRAMRSIFGQDGARTPAQQIVVRYLEKRGHVYGNIFTGDNNPTRAAIREGARQMAIEIIQMANSEPGDAPEKPKTTKQEGSNE